MDIQVKVSIRFRTDSIELISILIMRSIKGRRKECVDTVDGHFMVNIVVTKKSTLFV